MVSEAGNPAIRFDNLLPLLEQLRQRNEDALERLYTQSVDHLYSLAYRMLGTVEDAEDVLSEVFLQVWQAPEKYSPERGSVMGWLFIMVRSRALDALRKRAHSPRIEQLDEVIDTVATEAPPPFAVLEQEQCGDRLRQALQQLTSVQRQMIELAFFEGLTHGEIAQRIDEPLGTVKSHLRRAQLHLEEMLSGQTSFSRTAPRNG